ncbi:MAG: nuclear transport factor 2 family protein [Jatrophihabitantaceae bacterium]
MKSLQEISDRIEIQDLITDYSYAVDTHRWDDLDAIFTPDAALDFTATGGIAGRLPEIKVWFEQVLNLFSSHQHLVATSKIAFDGDTATARTICHNPMTLDDHGTESVVFVGLWYDDTFVRTPDGWRISARKQRKSYLHGLPHR